MKIAIVHDWLTGMRGGEKCLEILCELYPEADLYTLIHIKGSLSDVIERMNIKTSFLQKIPGIEKNYRNYLLFMPKAIESFNLSSYDLVISSSHCVAKGVITGPKTCHISYVHTPVRYAWDMYDQYFAKEKNIIKKMVIYFIMSYIRKWDKSSAKRVNYYLANSFNIAGKIKKNYGFDSEVIYPPVEIGDIPLKKQAGDGYLIVSAFAPYKRIDIAVEAFNELGYPLKIIGKGQDEAKLKKAAKSNITFKGWAPDCELRGYYERCTALIFPGEEDFGIVPVEVQAAGRPVIAYGKGGVLETVIPHSSGDCENAHKPTGLFFHEQTARSLIEAIKKFEEIKDTFDPVEIRKNAERFHRSIFKEKIKSFVLKKITEFNA